MAARATEGETLQSWMHAVLSHLQQRHETGTLGDCPLPVLFERCRGADLSIAEFHDGLRLLHERELIDLHPWTGSLYDLPEPSLALQVGYEIAYYASLRFTPGESDRSLNHSAGAKQIQAEVTP